MYCTYIDIARFVLKINEFSVFPVITNKLYILQACKQVGTKDCGMVNAWVWPWLQSHGSYNTASQFLGD